MVMTDQVINCNQACTVTVQHVFALPVLDLSIEEGAAISSAILLIWAIGWGFRALIQVLRHTDGNQTKED